MNSEDEIEEIPSWHGVPGTIILINVKTQDTTQVALASTCEMLRQHLRFSTSHNIGVCLYGTEETTSSSFGIKSVVDVFPLSLPSLDNFKKLKSLNAFTYGQAKEFRLSDVLWHCSKMFANCKKQLLSRTVLLLSRLDVPPEVSDEKPTLKRVVDLVDSNIEIRIINISNENGNSLHPFYEKFLIEANKGKDIILPRPIWNHKEIAYLIYQQSHRHLSVAKLDFEIGNDIAIGVGVYTLLKHAGQAYHKKVDLDRECNTIVKSVTKTVKVTVDTNEEPMDIDEDENKSKQIPLLKSELLYYQTYGGERIKFTENEMKTIRNPFGPPMMKLIGFKSAAVMCKEKWFLKMGYFLFPNENKINGSIVAFKAMHQACAEMSMVAICTLCTRVNARPNIVALSPCTHPLGLDADLGFNVIHIPFVENVRDIPAEGSDLEISENHKKTMKHILQSVMFDYRPDMFENPKLQSEFRAIEATALDEDDIELFVDTTKADAQSFENIEGDLFEEVFGPFGAVAAKRAASSSITHTNSKQGKDIDESVLKNNIINKTVHVLTVTQLKQILKSKEIADLPALTGLKKDQLVELVYKHVAPLY